MADTFESIRALLLQRKISHAEAQKRFDKFPKGQAVEGAPRAPVLLPPDLPDE